MKLKRLVAGVLSAAMMLSVGSSLAFATDFGSNGVVLNPTADLTYGDYDYAMTFSSTMYLATDAISAPDITYMYTMEAIKVDTTYTDSAGDTITILAGGPGSWTDIIANFSSEDRVAIGDDNSRTVDWTLAFEIDDFTTTGIYGYTLTEAIMDPDTGLAVENPSYDGLLNESVQTRYVYVTVSTAADGSSLEISEIIMTKGELTSASADYVKSNGFIHSYGITGIDTDEDGTPDEPANAVADGQDFVITTTAKGTMANTQKAFSFAVLKADLGTEFGTMQFTITGAYKDAALTIPLKTIVMKGDPISGVYIEQTFYMSQEKSGTVVIENVIEGMEFTIEISDPAATDEGYSFYARNYDATYTAGITSLTADSTLRAWSALVANSTDENVTDVDTYKQLVDTDYTDNEGIDFATVKGEEETNDKEDFDDDDIVYSAGFPDTGVVLDLAPYAIMMVLALGAISFRFVRVARKTEE